MNQPVNIAIIGGGAAGLTAAITAARRGARVRVLERMQRVGKKILATGNGRCNITNERISINHYHGAAPKFAAAALQQFDVPATLAFFQELGLAVRTDEEGKVYPLTDQAGSVLDVMRYELEQLGVEIICEAAVKDIARRGAQFVCATNEGPSFTADRVILAAGGKSTPNLGSNGGGFKLAQALGHTIIEPFPALVQVKLDGEQAHPWLKQLTGIRIQAMAEALLDGQLAGGQAGELLFTDYGISGLPILQLSRIVGEYAHNKTLHRIALKIDLFPNQPDEALTSLLRQRFAASPQKTLEFSLVGLLHKRLIPILLQEAGFSNTARPCGTMAQPEIKRLANQLKSWCLRPSGTMSWMTSQVTAGGIDVRQVDRQSMESKVVSGLYFAGEVLDIDGDCGGYNLQWAWSSGHVAGESAAQAK